MWCTVVLAVLSALPHYAITASHLVCASVQQMGKGLVSTCVSMLCGVGEFKASAIGFECVSTQVGYCNKNK